MSDVLNLLCDYAAAGAVVDRSLIAKVESEIARLYAAAGASEIARLTERLEKADHRCELYRQAGAKLLQAFQSRFCFVADELEYCLKTVDIEVEIEQSRTTEGV